MPYRVAASVLAHLLPVKAGKSPETLPGHTLKVGEQLRDAATVKPAAAASRINVTLDSVSSVAVSTANGIWRSGSVTSKRPAEAGKYLALSQGPIPISRF